ncbi:MAG TPA: TetR family transcriptional regulator [Acidimicrobiales bacterium]|nr:TetR family transcriptional regulator [Acidimicrobiales bacterium]
MPRDATGTRQRLIEAAEDLFASRGLHQATTREILAAAGQRNASALTYHFGTREQLLWAILERHNEPLEAGRAAWLSSPVQAMATRDLVAALVVPYAGCLGTASGRDYLRIVAQMTEVFPMWRAGPVTAPVLNAVLEVLEGRAPGAGATQRQRVVGMIMLMTTACAERARAVAVGDRLESGDDEFVTGLVDMIVALLEAPTGPPVGDVTTAARSSA